MGPCFTRSAVVKTAWHGWESLKARFIPFLFKEILRSPLPLLLALREELGSESIRVRAHIPSQPWGVRYFSVAARYPFCLKERDASWLPSPSGTWSLMNMQGSFHQTMWKQQPFVFWKKRSQGPP